MAISKQVQRMMRIGELLSIDLGYIYGPKESGVSGRTEVGLCGKPHKQPSEQAQLAKTPNGAKKEFLDISAAFLRRAANDLGLTRWKVNKNPAGIAVSGEVSLTGYWHDSCGIYLMLEQCHFCGNQQLYRSIGANNKRGLNCYIPVNVFQQGDYPELLRLLRLQKEVSGRVA